LTNDSKLLTMCTLLNHVCNKPVEQVVIAKALMTKSVSLKWQWRPFAAYVGAGRVFFIEFGASDSWWQEI